MVDAVAREAGGFRVRFLVPMAMKGAQRVLWFVVGLDSQLVATAGSSSGDREVTWHNCFVSIFFWIEIRD